MNKIQKRQSIGGCLGAVIGGLVGYFLTVYVLCYLVIPESNLCGLPAALISLPVGLKVGAVAGRFLVRRDP